MRRVLMLMVLLALVCGSVGAQVEPDWDNQPINIQFANGKECLDAVTDAGAWLGLREEDIEKICEGLVVYASLLDLIGLNGRQSPALPSHLADIGTPVPTDTPAPSRVRGNPFAGATIRSAIWDRADYMDIVADMMPFEGKYADSCLFYAEAAVDDYFNRPQQYDYREKFLKRCT